MCVDIQLKKEIIVNHAKRQQNVQNAMKNRRGFHEKCYEKLSLDDMNATDKDKLYKTSIWPDCKA